MRNMLHSVHASWNGSRVLPLSESYLSFLLGTDVSEQRYVCDTTGERIWWTKNEEIPVFISLVWRDQNLNHFFHNNSWAERGEWKGRIHKLSVHQANLFFISALQVWHLCSGVRERESLILLLSSADGRQQCVIMLTKQSTRRCHMCTRLHKEQRRVLNCAAVVSEDSGRSHLADRKRRFALASLQITALWISLCRLRLIFEPPGSPPTISRWLGDAVAWERWRFLSLGQFRSFSFLSCFSLLGSLADGSLRRSYSSWMDELVHLLYLW